MERKETTMLSKVAFIALILCLITGITLTILDVMDILTGLDLLLDVIFCVGWLLLGIVHWEKERPHSIFCFIFFGLKLIFIFI